MFSTDVLCNYRQTTNEAFQITSLTKVPNFYDLSLAKWPFKVKHILIIYAKRTSLLKMC